MLTRWAEVETPVRLSPPPAGSRLDADVCVIGAGAAGITIAQALGRAGIDTILLEAGGREPGPEADEPYRGRSVEVYGGRISDMYLHRTRLRWFGGTTNHWAGWCRPLDAIDLAARAWVPDSGWPLLWAELAPWYEPAAAMVGVGAFVGSTAPRLRRNAELPLAADANFQARLFRMSKPTRFGPAYGPELDASAFVRVVADAPVRAIRSDPARVTHVEVAGPAGPWTVHARRYVLACGGIENARLLLASDADRPGGLGNDHDLVGRYFADHPEVKPCARVILQSPRRTSLKPWLGWLDSKLGATHAYLQATDAFLEREGLLRYSAELRPVDDPPDPALACMTDAVGALGALDGREVNTALLEVVGRVEVAPNRESRVTLGEDRDAGGMRRVVLDWRIDERTERTLVEGTRELARTLAIAGLGRLQPLTRPAWKQIVGGCHHMGTTRMAADPTRGVVDARCRVHSAPNLWVGGSSVFATTGIANPTLTIVALALRIADDLIRGEP